MANNWVLVNCWGPAKSQPYAGTLLGRGRKLKGALAELRCRDLGGSLVGSIPAGGFKLPFTVKEVDFSGDPNTGAAGMPGLGMQQGWTTY